MFALAGASLLGSTLLGGPFGHRSNDSEADCPPAYSSSIQVADSEAGQSEADEAKYLATLARVTPAQAQSAALARFAGGSAKTAKIENDGGQVIYSVEVKDAASVLHDVKVDAGNATVLHVDDETNDGAGEAGCA